MSFLITMCLLLKSPVELLACGLGLAQSQEWKTVPEQDAPKTLAMAATENRDERMAISTLAGRCVIKDVHLRPLNTGKLVLETWNLAGEFKLDAVTDEVLSLLKFQSPRHLTTIAGKEITALTETEDAQVATRTPSVLMQGEIAYWLNDDIDFGVRKGDPRTIGWIAEKSNLVRALPRYEEERGRRRALYFDPRVCFDVFDGIQFHDWLKQISDNWGKLPSGKSLLVKNSGDKITYRLTISGEAVAFVYEFGEPTGMQVSHAYTIDPVSSVKSHEFDVDYSYVGTELMPVRFRQFQTRRIDSVDVREGRDVSLTDLRVNAVFPDGTFTLQSLGCRIGDRVQDHITNDISLVWNESGESETVEEFESRFPNGFPHHGHNSAALTTSKLFVANVIAAVCLVIWLRARLRRTRKFPEPEGDACRLSD